MRRLLAHSATYHIYYEAYPDFFVHTAASRLLAENDGMRKWFLLGTGELLPATLKVRTVCYPTLLSGIFGRIIDRLTIAMLDRLQTHS